MRLQHLARPRNRLGDARLVKRLQDVIHGVYVKRLHRVLIKSGGKYHVRHFHLAFNNLFQHAEPIQPGHFHIQKHQVRRMLLDQRHGLHPVLPLSDHIDLGEPLQQEG